MERELLALVDAGMSGGSEATGCQQAAKEAIGPAGWAGLIVPWAHFTCGRAPGERYVFELQARDVHAARRQYSKVKTGAAAEVDGGDAGLVAVAQFNAAHAADLGDIPHPLQDILLGKTFSPEFHFANPSCHWSVRTEAHHRMLAAVGHDCGSDDEA